MSDEQTPTALLDQPPSKNNNKTKEKCQKSIFWRIFCYIKKATRNQRQGYGKPRDSYDWATLAVAVIGTFVVGRYTWLTSEQVELSRIAFLAQQRPWLKISDIRPISENGDQRQLPIIFSATIENIGNVPATNVVASEYKFYPLFKKGDESVIAAHLRDVVRNECINDISTRGARDHRTGSIIFHDDKST